MASMITFGVTVGLIQTVLKKYEVVGTLHAEFDQFRAVLLGVKTVLQNMEEKQRSSSGHQQKEPSFIALKQIHAAVQEGNEVIDDIVKTRKCVVNFFSDDYLSKIKRATSKIQLALEAATFANVVGLPEVKAAISEFHRSVEGHHSEIVETLKSHDNRLDQLNLLMQAHLIKDKEEFSEMLLEAADKAEVFYRANKPLIDKNMYDWVMRISKEEASQNNNSLESQLLCPISKDVMEDPVLLVQSGNSYDRKNLCQSLLNYPTLDPQSGMEYAKPLEYVDNVVVRSILIDKGRYVKYDDAEFLAEYPVVWKRKMTELGFLGAETLQTTGRPESERSIVQYEIGSQQNDSSKNICCNGFSQKKKGMIVLLATIAVLIAIFLSITITSLSKDDDDDESSRIPPPPSSSPTVLPNTHNGTQTNDSDRSSGLVNLINSLTLSGQTLEYPSLETPEEQALAWLVDEDPLYLDAVVDVTRIQQRYALLTLWFHTNPTLGANSSSWLNVTNECDWEGVASCSEVTPVRQVTKVDMSNKNLFGEIPHDFGLLTALTSLRLNANELNGKIPSSFSYLRSLSELNLEFNTLDGSIPSSLSELSLLTVLDVSYNRLTGTIPLWLSRVTDLTLVDFSSNQFRGTIPGSSLSQSTGLLYLGLHTNSLTGTIPAALSQLSALNWVAFNVNPGLTGTIPAELVSWTNLFDVFFYDTNLNGTMPLCSLNTGYSRLVADCLEVDCPCCTHCCPSVFNETPQYEYC